MSKPRNLADHPNTRGTAATEDVTTSATDATAGRLLKVGDFGLGASGAPDFPSADFNSFEASGVYSGENDHTNSPPNGGNAAILSLRSSRLGLKWQMAVDGVGVIWIRGHVDTVGWSPWRRVFTQNTILGTVSQSSGVPTGAIIERGSNSNGEYVKYADGTLICTRSFTLNVAISTAYFGGFRSTGGNNVAFAATFVNNTYRVALTAIFEDSFGIADLGPVYRTVSTFDPIFTSVTTSATKNRVGEVVAIGRWF